MFVENLELPDSLGVMTLPGATLFPGSLLPLFIFEQKYRVMLAEVLEADRIFAVAATGEGERSNEVFSVGGAGVVRACVANENGTSNLILQGISRVRFKDFSTDSKFPKTSIDLLSSHTSSPSESDSLQREVFAMAKSHAKNSDSFPAHFLEILEDSANCEIFTDLAASCLVESTPVRLRLMQELDVTKRMEILAAYFTHLLATKR